MVSVGLVEVIISIALRSPPWLGQPVRTICVTNDHRYVPLVVSTPRSFPRSWLITGFVTRLTRLVSLVVQERLTLPEHLSSPSVFSGVRVTRFICMFCRSLLVLLYFFLSGIVLSVLLRYAYSDYLPLVSSNSSYYNIVFIYFKEENTNVITTLFWFQWACAMK